jgi:hypothetical protein
MWYLILIPSIILTIVMIWLAVVLDLDFARWTREDKEWEDLECKGHNRKEKPMKLKQKNRGGKRRQHTGPRVVYREWTHAEDTEVKVVVPRTGTQYIIKVISPWEGGVHTESYTRHAKDGRVVMYREEKMEPVMVSTPNTEPEIKLDDKGLPVYERVEVRWYLTVPALGSTEG